MTLRRCICLLFVGALLLPSAVQAEFEFSPNEWKPGLGLVNPEGPLGWGVFLSGRTTLGYINEQFSADAGMHFWKKSGVRDIAFFGGGTFHLPVDHELLLPYVRGGLGLHFFDSDHGGGNTDLGLYLGGGVDYQFSDTMLLGGEMLYHVADGDAFMIGGNVTFLTDTF